MDATGLFTFSALALCPLMMVLWYVERIPAREIGFAWGRGCHYGLALLHPLLVLGPIVALAMATGAADFSRTDWTKAWLNCALIGASTILVAIVTEEGFFRGWLWASLRRSGQRSGAVLVWTSVAFALWHLPAVLLETGFAPPKPQIPIFVANAVLLGAAWGLLRSISRSLLVSSVGHGVWNGLVYTLFGFGDRIGALGIRETAIYGPEVGLLGVALNGLFVAGLWTFRLRTADSE
jgi:membrane protease YdiL (CAAX protease family)